jgi:hypothetical protein
VSVFQIQLHLRFRPAREILLNATGRLNAADGDSESSVSGINDESTRGWKNADPGYSESTRHVTPTVFQLLKQVSVSVHHRSTHTERTSLLFFISHRPLTGYAVVHLVEALHYKLEGHEFDSRWDLWYWLNPSGHIMALGLTQSLTKMCTRGIPCSVEVTGA